VTVRADDLVSHKKARSTTQCECSSGGACGILMSPTDGGRSVSLTGNFATRSKGVARMQACTQPVIPPLSSGLDCRK
jgi:hypothetical protein